MQRSPLLETVSVDAEDVNAESSPQFVSLKVSSVIKFAAPATGPVTHAPKVQGLKAFQGCYSIHICDLTARTGC